MGYINNYMNEIFILVIGMTIIFFLLAGYAYPPTDNDRAKNNVYPFDNDNSYDRGKFSQYFISIVFTMGVMYLGFYINTTFVKYGIKNWGMFASGIFLMYLYGLGKIGELMYNHEVFDVFKDLILPVALILIAIGAYNISKDITGGED